MGRDRVGGAARGTAHEVGANQEVRGLQSQEQSFRKEGERTMLAKMRVEGCPLGLL